MDLLFEKEVSLILPRGFTGLRGVLALLPTLRLGDL